MKTVKVLLFLSFFSISGCWEWTEDGGGSEYYEFSFIDNIASVIESDSIYIVIEQTDNILLLTDTIPHQIISKSSLEDTIILNVTVKYGTSSQNFIPTKKVHVVKDSMYLSYEFATNNSHRIAKSLSINQAEIPAPNYYNVEKIDIITSPDKQVWLYNRIKSFR